MKVAASAPADAQCPVVGDRLHVAMLTSVGNRCGIAAYTRALVQALREFVDVVVEPIEVGRQPLEHYQEQAKRLNMADVVHIQHEHSFWGGVLPNHSVFWNLRYLIEKPLVLTAHTTTSLRDLLKLPSERRPIHRIAKELLVRRRAYRESVEIAPFITGRCIVHTREGGEALVARGANGKYVHVIPAGVPETMPLPGSGARFREMAAPNNRIVALFGYIAPNKGYELAFDALASLPNDVALLIAGGARNEEMVPYEESIRRRIEERGLVERIFITGHLSEQEIADAMAAADVVVAPHTIATGSYSIMIPLAYGKAIAASDLACFREIQEQTPDPGAMEMFRAGDVDDFANALNRVLAGDARRAEMERLAADYARTHSWREVARKTIDIYREAIADEKRLSHHSMAAS